MKGISTSKKNLCPVCGNHHGCKIQDDELVLCLRSSSQQDAPPGYRFIKSLRNAMGGLFGIDGGDRSDDTWQDRIDRINQRRQRERERTRKLLSIEERDRSYQAIVSQLELSPQHTQILLERGLTLAEIEQAGFRSWEPLKRVTGGTSQLAGIDSRGDRLVGSKGIFLPAYDPNGHVTGAQLKTDSGRPGKYIWLSSYREDGTGGNGPHLPNDELPLFVWKHPEASQTSLVILSEGALKSAIAASLLWRMGLTDIAVIGTASSGFYGADTLKSYLERLSPQRVALAPDAGAINNTGNIPAANQETIKRCQAWGYPVDVLWWGQTHKTKHLDIDELLVGDRWGEVQTISPDNFFQLHPVVTREKLENHTPQRAGLHRSDFPVSNPHPTKGDRTSNDKGWLFNLKRQLSKTVERRNAWGFGRKDKVEHHKEKNEQSAETESNQTSKYGESGALSNGLGDTDLHTLERSYQDVGSRPGRNEEDERNRHSNGSSHTYPRSAPSGRGEGSQQYQPTNERLHSWSLSHKQGRKYIHDTSATGTGKSFDAGMATPELFDARQLIYVSAEHRNSTVPTLKNWPDLEARHKGLVRDEFGKLRRVTTPGQPYVVSPNCSRNDTISALRSKNIGGADTSGLICQTCPNREPCQAGAVFGFLHDRMTTLKQPRFRAHPQSLPDPAEFDYSSVVLIWDEASEIIKAHRSIDVTAQDLQRAIADLAVKLPLVFDALRPVLTTLHLYLEGEVKQPYYGWKDALIREALPNLDGVDMAAIREALTPDLDELLNTTKDYGVDLGDLPRGVRKNFTGSDSETSTRISNELSLNWLPDFLDVHLGNLAGSLRVQDGTLTITLPDPRLGEIARSASGNIFLDATATCEDLALVLGIEPSEILTVRQETPDTSNLEIIQVATMGRLGVGSERSEFCQKRVDALIEQIKRDTPGDVAVIDFKRHTETGDGKRHWWVDSRGVNDFKDCMAATSVGVPCRNLSELEAEFKVLYGRAPKEGTEKVRYPIQLNAKLPSDIQPWFEMQVSVDVEFRDFCRRRILADIHQWFGRIRANLRPEQKLKIYFIADYPLDIPVTLKLASDITPEAATKTERVEMGIRRAVQQLKDAGQKITQSAIAQLVGVTQGYISRFRKLLQTLLSDSNSKSNNFDESPPDLGELEWISQEYLPLLAESPPDELLSKVLIAFEVYGQEVWRQIWDATPAAVQIKILQALMFTLSPGELRSLCMAVGVKV